MVDRIGCVHNPVAAGDKDVVPAVALLTVLDNGLAHVFGVLALLGAAAFAFVALAPTDAADSEPITPARK